MKKTSSRTKCVEDVALAEKYGVSDRTIREWRSRGYPVDDRCALYESLAEQRTQPEWFTAEAERRRFISSQRRLELSLYGGQGESNMGALLAMGWKWDEMPWPYGYGRDLTDEEKHQVEMMDNDVAMAAYEEHWRDVIRSDQYTGEFWEKMCKGDIEGAKAMQGRRAHEDAAEQAD